MNVRRAGPARSAPAAAITRPSSATAIPATPTCTTATGSANGPRPASRSTAPSPSVTLNFLNALLHERACHEAPEPPQQEGTADRGNDRLDRRGRRRAPAEADAHANGLLDLVLARLGGRCGRRHGGPVPAGRARHLRLLRHLLLAGAGPRSRQLLA